MLPEGIDFADINWPTGRDNPSVVKLERDLRKRLKRDGIGLIPDRTRFVDPRFQGGYMIVSEDRILAGRNYELSIADVVQWAENHKRMKRKKEDKE